MKKQFILFCVMLIAVAPVCFAQASPAKPAKSASNQTAITDLEKSAWESYKNKQADAFRKLMSKDYYGTYAEDIKNLDREVADMAKADLRDCTSRARNAFRCARGRIADHISGTAKGDTFAVSLIS
jgi:hypothetical protein